MSKGNSLSLQKMVVTFLLLHMSLAMCWETEKEIHLSLPHLPFVRSNGGSSKMSPALCQWSEVMNHPGLVCCVQQTTGIPLVIMVKPDTFLVQEIKTLPAKAKVRGTCNCNFDMQRSLRHAKKKSNPKIKRKY